MSTIDLSSELEGVRVNEVIRRYPETVHVFAEYGIDACCGGAAPVQEAAARHGVALEELLERLREVAAAG